MEQGRTHRVRPTGAQRNEHKDFYYSFFFPSLCSLCLPYWVGISPSTPLGSARGTASAPLSATLRSDTVEIRCIERVLDTSAPLSATLRSDTVEMTEWKYRIMPPSVV